MSVIVAELMATSQGKSPPLRVRTNHAFSLVRRTGCMVTEHDCVLDGSLILRVKPAFMIAAIGMSGFGGLLASTLSVTRGSPRGNGRDGSLLRTRCRRIRQCTHPWRRIRSGSRLHSLAGISANTTHSGCHWYYNDFHRGVGRDQGIHRPTRPRLRLVDKQTNRPSSAW